MSVDVEKICRTCLGLNGPLLSIYDSSGHSSGTGCLADMLSELTNSKPRRADNLPEKVCLTCISEINRCYSFKLKCENSTRTLCQLLPNALPEEVIETSLPKVHQAHKEVQTVSVSKDKKFRVTHQMVQTDVQASEKTTVILIPQNSTSACKRKKELEDNSNITPERQLLLKSKRAVQLDEEQNEGELLLELLDETDGNARDKDGTKRRESFSQEDIEEHTSYYELSDSQLEYNVENEAEENEVRQNLETFVYDEEEVQAVEIQQQEEPQKEGEEYRQLIYNEAAEGEGQEVDFNFTIYDNGDGETQVVPKFRNTRAATSERTSSSQERLALIEKKATEQCPDCDMVFVSSKTRRRHMIKKHNWKAEELELSDAQIDLRSRSQRLNRQKQEDASISGLQTEMEESLLEELQVKQDRRTSNGEEARSTVNEPISADEEYENIDSDSGAQEEVVKLSYFCDHCNAGFARIKSLNFHQKLNACTAPNYKCDECERVFISERTLQEHKETHVYSHTCSECNKVYTTADELSKHMVLDHNRSLRNQCSTCKKVFTMLSTLKDHMRTHSGEKPFVCPHCNRAFSQNANLKQHVMRHSKEKRFKCDMCPSGFVTKAELRSHKRTHTGDTPYTCEYCRAVFTTSSSLMKHRRKHTGERPYACDICPMRFASLNVLKNHRRTHTGEKPYKCIYCDKAFTQRGDCHIHQRTHTGDQQYACYCGRKFTHLSTLRSHMKLHNKQDGLPHRERSSMDIVISDDESPVHFTILKKEVGAEDNDQHERNETRKQHAAQIADDELIQMNIEMC